MCLQNGEDFRVLEGQTYMNRICKRICQCNKQREQRIIDHLYSLEI